VYECEVLGEKSSTGNEAYCKKTKLVKQLQKKTADKHSLNCCEH